MIVGSEAVQATEGVSEANLLWTRVRFRTTGGTVLDTSMFVRAHSLVSATLAQHQIGVGDKPIANSSLEIAIK